MRMRKTILQTSGLILSAILFVSHPTQAVSEQVRVQWSSLVSDTDEHEMEKMIISFIHHPEGRKGFPGFSYADSWSLVWDHFITIKLNSESRHEKAFAAKALAKLVAHHKYAPDGIFREDIEPLKAIPVGKNESDQDEEKFFVNTRITPSEHRTIEEVARGILPRERPLASHPKKVHSAHHKISKGTPSEGMRLSGGDDFLTSAETSPRTSFDAQRQSLGAVRHKKTTKLNRFSPIKYEDDSGRASPLKRELGVAYVYDGRVPIKERILEVYLDLKARHHGREPKRSDIWDQVNGEGYAVSRGQVSQVIAKHKTKAQSQEAAASLFASDPSDSADSSVFEGFTP